MNGVFLCAAEKSVAPPCERFFVIPHPTENASKKQKTGHKLSFVTKTFPACHKPVTKNT
jgi:hypothetical protein